MKQALLFLLLVFSFYCGQCQLSVYARFTGYDNQVLTTDGSAGNSGLISANTIDPSSPEFFKLSTFTQSVEQTLNIGSQSTGAGAGKIAFNPIGFSRPADRISPILFSHAASGTPYQTIEVFFTDGSGRIATKQLYKLAAVKTVSWAAASCTNDCPAVIETVTIEYGGQIVFMYKSPTGYLSTPVIAGWNRVKNVQDNDPNAVIK